MAGPPDGYYAGLRAFGIFKPTTAALRDGEKRAFLPLNMSWYDI